MSPSGADVFSFNFSNFSETHSSTCKSRAVKMAVFTNNVLVYVHECDCRTRTQGIAQP